LVDLEEVMKKLDELALKIAKIEEELRTLKSSEAELYNSLQIAKTVLESYSRVLGFTLKVERLAMNLEGDIEKHIVRILAKQPMNVSQLTEALKKVRGTASRRIVAAKLKKLEAAGIVERIKGEKRGKYYRLVDKDKSKEEPV
jgi:DNA-binding transcriptional ArsR family regulator